MPTLRETLFSICRYKTARKSRRVRLPAHQMSNRSTTMHLKHRLTRMTEELEDIFPLNPDLKDALLSVDRLAFATKGLEHFAYVLDAPTVIREDYLPSSVEDIKMLNYLETQKGNTVLIAGCRNGYLAAVLSRIADKVFVTSKNASSLLDMQEKFLAFGLDNVCVHLGDLLHGQAKYSPFDRILIPSPIPEAPHSLFEQLADQGILAAIVPIDDLLQVITRYYKREGKILQETIEISKHQNSSALYPRYMIANKL